jgi:hypothetical protein
MPPTRRQRKRLPKAKDIATAMRALSACVPMHERPEHGLRESLKGVVNYRIRSVTNDREWTVDVYRGDYFVVTCRGFVMPCPSVPSAVGHLRRMLGLRERTSDQGLEEPHLSLVPINSKEELAKVLVLQKTIGEQALAEIAHLVSLPPEDYVASASRVLEKYARYATLTEFRKMPSLADSQKWGATFGVSVLVDALVIEQARFALHAGSPLRHEYMAFLGRLREKGGGTIEMDALASLFAVFSENYGLAWASGDSLSLTVVGSRVLLHMLDTSRAVEEIAKAVRKFLGS